MIMRDRRELFDPAQVGGCKCGDTKPEAPSRETEETATGEKVLHADLLVIDLETCTRCVPTGDQFLAAVRLLRPVAGALGIELRHREIIVRTEEEAKVNALLSSPTIRLNGRDIAQDIRESECASCGELTDDDTGVECREWHYRGQVYPSAPLALLVEAIMEAILNLDKIPPVVPARLEELPENLRRYFRNRKHLQTGPSCCC